MSDAYDSFYFYAPPENEALVAEAVSFGVKEPNCRHGGDNLSMGDKPVISSRQAFTIKNPM